MPATMSRIGRIAMARGVTQPMSAFNTTFGPNVPGVSSCTTIELIEEPARAELFLDRKVA